MEKAVYPDRVRFAIFQQNEENESDCADFSDICGPKGSNPAHIICSRKNAIKIRRVHCKQAKGPLWARANHDEMIGADEDFAMQIDCHSLFTERWDEKILKMWYRCKNEYAVITYYPRDVRTSMVEGRNIGVNDNIVVFGRFTFEGLNGMPRIKSAAQVNHPLKDKTIPLLTPFLGGGFSFSRAHRVRTVKNDPYLPHIFDGEEIVLTTRLWTYGYDFYAPTEDIVFHYYGFEGAPKRPTFWEIDYATTEREGKRSTARIRHLLGMPPNPQQQANLTEIERYGMGNKRPLDMFWKIIGVDMKTLEVEDKPNYFYNGLFHMEHCVEKEPGEQMTHFTTFQSANEKYQIFANTDKGRRNRAVKSKIS